ncbi:hypothetical protein CSPT_1005 [Campylobacter sputorum subsp. sputorum]|nr:hypothetical protein F7P64_07590 [Campylobacter sputorum subsp. sputorum]QEL05406.1 hypothetical protein CSPT_1005 [Campylobacter sputorum subsp. sputorum]
MKDIIMQWLKKWKKNWQINLFSLMFRACNMLAKNRINRNKLYNKAKFYNKNIDFMLFIRNDINGHIECGRG